MPRLAFALLALAGLMAAAMPTARAAAVVAPEATQNDCDRLVADPWDGHKTSDGIADRALRGSAISEALAACRDAAARPGAALRLRYQYGRVLALAERYDDAAALLEPLARVDYPAAQRWLGWLHLVGRGAEWDQAQAAELYRRAAESGDAPAQAWLAAASLSGKLVPHDPKAAADWYGQAAEQGHTPAQVELARLLLHGDGIEQDQAAAVRWYVRAAEAGDVRAARALIDLAKAQGDTIALAWLTDTAAAGGTDQQFALAEIYDTGQSLPLDVEAAARWYRAAAEGGHLRAQSRLGELYETGLGVAQDYGEAAKWYRKAAEHGQASAQMALGRLYQRGLGVPKDEAEAAKWFGAVAGRGCDCDWQDGALKR